MTDYMDTAMWAKCSTKGVAQWAIYDHYGILLCVLTIKGLSDHLAGLSYYREVDEQTIYLCNTRPNPQLLKKKLKRFEKMRTWHHLLKHATCLRRHGSYWIIDVGEDRWLGAATGDTAFVASLCSQLSVPFDETRSVVLLR